MSVKNSERDVFETFKHYDLITFKLNHVSVFSLHSSSNLQVSNFHPQLNWKIKAASDQSSEGLSALLLPSLSSGNQAPHVSVFKEKKT